VTYLADELAHKQPIELYTFTLPSGVFYWTDSERTVVHPISGLSYLPEPISRGQVAQSGENSSMTLEIEVDATNPAGEFFRTPFLPARTVWVVVERTHLGAVDTPEVLFRGQVTQCIFEKARARMTCVPTRQAVQRQVPTVLVSSLCTNTLYDQRCLVDPSAYRQSVTITDVSGILVTVSAHGKPNGWFNGGILEAPGHPSVTIRDQTGTVLSLLYNYGYTVGMAVTVLPGCDKRLSTCTTKFHNSTHFQGFPNMPVIDPFVDSVN
jgi:hypothetical protein